MSTTITASQTSELAWFRCSAEVSAISYLSYFITEYGLHGRMSHSTFNSRVESYKTFKRGRNSLCHV